MKVLPDVDFYESFLKISSGFTAGNRLVPVGGEIMESILGFTNFNAVLCKQFLLEFLWRMAVHHDIAHLSGREVIVDVIGRVESRGVLVHADSARFTESGICSARPYRSF